MNSTHNQLLIELLRRDDKLSINNGVIEIQPNSGKPVPDAWITDNGHLLMRQLCKLTLIPMFEYVGHSVGEFGINSDSQDKKDRKGFSGLCLQFADIVTGEDACLIFNVDTKRKRDTRYGKKGSNLPKGQFNVGVRSSFYKFWTINDFPLPRRRSSFHDVLGKLKGYCFTGEVLSNNRFKDKKLTLTSITSEQILGSYQQYFISKQSAIYQQQLSNYQATYPSSDVSQSFEYKGLQSNLTTEGVSYGISNQGGAELSNVIALHKQSKRPEEQSDEEWYSDYDRA